MSEHILAGIFVLLMPISVAMMIAIIVYAVDRWG